MFKSVIKLTEKAVKLNLEHADRGDVQSSTFTNGQVDGYVGILRSWGCAVDFGTRNDRGCDRIWYLGIDGVVMVRNSKIDYDGYNELLKK